MPTAVRLLVGLACALSSGLSSGLASAAEPISIGGKFAVSADVALDTLTEGDATDFGLGFEITRVTRNGRHEFGGGIDLELSFEDDEDFGLYFLGVTYRHNLPPIGPERNIILYGSLNGGMSILTLKAAGFTDEDGFVFASLDETEVSGAGGPALGAEYYFTPSVAVQLEDFVLLYEGGSGDVEVVNAISIGVRVLF